MYIVVCCKDVKMRSPWENYFLKIEITFSTMVPLWVNLNNVNFWGLNFYAVTFLWTSHLALFIWMWCKLIRSLDLPNKNEKYFLPLHNIIPIEWWVTYNTYAMHCIQSSTHSKQPMQKRNILVIKLYKNVLT